MRTNTVRSKGKDKAGLKPIIVLNEVQRLEVESAHVMQRQLEQKAKVPVEKLGSALHDKGVIVALGGHNCHHALQSQFVFELYDC